MKAYLVRKARPRKLAYLEDVVEEFGQFECALTDCSNLRCLFYRGHVHAYLMHAAAGRSDDVVVAREVLDEQRLGAGGFLMASRIGHGLPAAGLVHRILDAATQPFQQLQCRNTDFRLECIHVARNEKTHTHERPPIGESIPRSVILTSQDSS